MKKATVRLKDIAERANVSRITVSKVLLNTGGSNVRISDETRNKVLAIAEEMNYKPNMAARMLAGKKSKIIGALIDSHAPLSLYKCLRQIERKLAERGYRLMVVHQHDDLGSIVDSLEDFSTYGAEGVICFAHNYPMFEKQLGQKLQAYPNILFIGQPCFDKCCFLEIDTKNAIRNLVHLLVKQNRKRIGIFLADKTIRTMALRYEGYVCGLKESGIELDDSSVMIDDKYKSIEPENITEIVDVLVKKQKVDAIISMNDSYAAQIMKQLNQEGFNVPGDIAITGFDNMDFTDFFTPSITTVDPCYTQLADEAVKLMLEILNDKNHNISQIIQPELIIRESTGI